MSFDHLQYMKEMDPDQLDQLMNQYGQDVWNFAYFLVKSRSVADDITQDVFLQAFLHVASFRNESSVKTWLLKITRNISLNYRKSAFFRKVLLVDIVVSKGNSQSAEQLFMEREASNEVWKHVFNLSVKYREILILHAKYQISLNEIAQILKIPVGTAKSRLFGARKKMHKLLKEEYVYETN